MPSFSDIWSVLVAVVPPLWGWITTRKQEHKEALIAKINELDSAWNREDIDDLLDAHRR